MSSNTRVVVVVVVVQCHVTVSVEACSNTGAGEKVSGRDDGTGSCKVTLLSRWETKLNILYCHITSYTVT